VIKHHIMSFYGEEKRRHVVSLVFLSLMSTEKSLRYPNPSDRTLGGPQSGCDKNLAICVSTTKMNPNPQFFNPQPSHLNDWAQVRTTENGQNGVCVCRFMSILLFASGGTHEYICIHSVTCVSRLVMHGCLLLLNETNLKLLVPES
jgi:hypothetical protein